MCTRRRVQRERKTVKCSKSTNMCVKCSKKKTKKNSLKQLNEKYSHQHAYTYTYLEVVAEGPKQQLIIKILYKNGVSNNNKYSHIHKCMYRTRVTTKQTESKKQKKNYI